MALDEKARHRMLAVLDNLRDLIQRQELDAIAIAFIGPKTAGIPWESILQGGTALKLSGMCLQMAVQTGAPDEVQAVPLEGERTH